jgi:hypothetical protein
VHVCAHWKRAGGSDCAAKENKLTGYYPIVFFWRFLASLRLNVAVLFLDTSINSSDFSGILS